MRRTLSTFFVALIVSSTLGATVTRAATESVSLGFDARRDGFGFANWGGVTADDDIEVPTLRRLFGDGVVCEQGVPDCRVREASVSVLDFMNKGLAGGRCEGMAVLAARLFVASRLVPLGGSVRPTWSLPRSEVVDSITFWWGSQFFTEVQRVSMMNRRLTARQIAENVFASIEVGRIVTMGLYKGGAAHTVLPIAATRSGGGYVIQVYDPNLPGTTHTIAVDSVDGTWEYDGWWTSDGAVGSVSGPVIGGLDFVPLDVRDQPPGVDF